MHGAIKNIFLTNPDDENDLDGFDELNTDVIVQFESGDQYAANFLSYNGLDTLIAEHRNSGELPDGEHYRILNVVLVNDVPRRNLYRVVEHMLAEGDFQVAFRKI